jgi:hypothetical protein
MKAKLIMITNPIICSADCEDGINPEANYFDAKVNGDNICTMNVMHTDDIYYYYYVNGIKENFRNVYKVIAGLPELPSIDWNNLHEEFGFIDIDKIANTRWKNLTGVLGFIDGFEQSQELNRNKFDLNDIKKSIHNGLALSTLSDELFTSPNFKVLIESFIDAHIRDLLKPKIFNIEIDDIFVTEDDERGTLPGSIPKIVNNSIKILKKI